MIQLESSQEKLEERQPADKIELSLSSFKEEKNFYSDFGE